METNNQQICAKSRNRKTSVRIELLDSQDLKVDEITADILGGSITIKNGIGSSFSRRSGSLDLKLIKSLSTQYYKIDLLHRVRIVIIIKDSIRKVSAEYNMGLFLMNSPNLSQSTTDSKITISLLDLMANYDGTFGKSVDSTQTVKINSGTPVVDSVIQVATDLNMMALPLNKLKIEYNDLTVIENIETSPDANVTDLLQSIMDDCLNYDLYFDENGYLIYESIKQRDNDIIYQEFNNSNVIVSYSATEDFGNARNIVYLLGAQIESSSNVNQPIQAQGVAILDDIKNPLCVQTLGERRITISKDKLQTVDQCNRQAQYELEQRSYYKEKLVVTLLPDPRLMPNRKIKLDYISDKEELEIHGSYLIDDFTIDLKVGGLMTLNLHKLYPTTT